MKLCNITLLLFAALINSEIIGAYASKKGESEGSSKSFEATEYDRWMWSREPEEPVAKASTKEPQQSLSQDKKDDITFDEIKSLLIDYGTYYEDASFDREIINLLADRINGHIYTMTSRSGFWDKQGNTMIHLAAQNNCVPVLNTLLHRYTPRKILRKNYAGKTALDLARENKNKEAIETIQQAINEHAAEVLEDLQKNFEHYFDYYSSHKNTRLTGSAMSKEKNEDKILDAIDDMLESIEPGQFLNDRIYKVLVWAAKYNCVEAVKCLAAEDGFNYALLAQNKPGKTPLEWAKNHKNKAIIDTLTSAERAEKHKIQYTRKQHFDTWRSEANSKINYAQAREKRIKDSLETYNKNRQKKLLTATFGAWKGAATEKAEQKKINTDRAKQRNENFEAFQKSKTKKQLNHVFKTWKGAAAQSMSQEAQRQEQAALLCDSHSTQRAKSAVDRLKRNATDNKHQEQMLEKADLHAHMQSKKRAFKQLRMNSLNNKSLREKKQKEDDALTQRILKQKEASKRQAQQKETEMSIDPNSPMALAGEKIRKISGQPTLAPIAEEPEAVQKNPAPQGSSQNNTFNPLVKEKLEVASRCRKDIQNHTSLLASRGFSPSASIIERFESSAALATGQRVVKGSRARLYDRAKKDTQLAASIRLLKKEIQKLSHARKTNQIDLGMEYIQTAREMEQIHTDPYYHARYTGDATALVARDHFVRHELNHYRGNPEQWWQAHNHSDKPCLVCDKYNAQMATAKQPKQRPRSKSL